MSQPKDCIKCASGWCQEHSPSRLSSSEIDHALRMRIFRKNNPDAQSKVNKRYYQNNPWAKYLIWARQRCTSKKCSSYPRYGGAGIKMLLNVSDVRKLWFRDNAASMKRPSLDRKNSSKDYTFKNCRFLEYMTNMRTQKSNKLTLKDVSAIKWALKGGVGLTPLAKNFGVSISMISKIKLGKAWT